MLQRDLYPWNGGPWTAAVVYTMKGCGNVSGYEGLSITDVAQGLKCSAAAGRSGAVVRYM